MLFLLLSRAYPSLVSSLTESIVCILQARLLRRLSRGIFRKSVTHQKRWVLVTPNCWWSTSQWITLFSSKQTCLICCGFSTGLHHLHGGPGWTVRLQRPWCGGYIAGWICGPPGSVWTPVSPPVPGCHVQQWQQGWQPPVPHLQNHLRREDRQPASRQGGVPCHPPLTARAPRLQNHPHHLQHPSWHPGTLMFHRFLRIISLNKCFQMCNNATKLYLVAV